MIKSILIVVAHPDDEVLGAGGYISNCHSLGYEVNLCVMSGNVAARNFRPTIDELHNDMKESSRVLGINAIEVGDFPNIEFNAVPHIQLVQFIEKAIIKYKPTQIITHHPNDLNNDHFHVSLACQAALRIFQRKTEIKPIEELLFMEIQSSTDWSINPSNLSFQPNYFYEIGEKGLNKKIEALKIYRGVMRDFPHPRSIEVITSLSMIRASQAGLMYAEAFQLGFKRISLTKEK